MAEFIIHWLQLDLVPLYLLWWFLGKEHSLQPWNQGKCLNTFSGIFLFPSASFHRENHILGTCHAWRTACETGQNYLGRHGSKHTQAPISGLYSTLHHNA
jgi:hypothetical protein